MIDNHFDWCLRHTMMAIIAANKRLARYITARQTWRNICACCARHSGGWWPHPACCCCCSQACQHLWLVSFHTTNNFWCVSSRKRDFFKEIFRFWCVFRFFMTQCQILVNLVVQNFKIGNPKNSNFKSLWWLSIANKGIKKKKFTKNMDSEPNWPIFWLHPLW